MRLLLTVLLPISLCAGTITVTSIGQTNQTSAETSVSGIAPCMDSGTTSAVCQSGAGVPGTPGVAYATASIYEGDLHVSAVYGGADTTATASASIKGSVLITGGTGTGYLSVVTDYDVGYPWEFATAVMVNGQSLIPGVGYRYSMVPFTFGQPVDYSLSVSTADLSSLFLNDAGFRIADVRVYGWTPSNYFCFEEGCTTTDPNYVDAWSVFSGLDPSVNGSVTPEPGTIALTALGLFALAVGRRRLNRADTVG